MNYRRVGGFFMLFYGVPNLGNPWTGRIYNGATSIVQQLHFLNASPKCRQNHDVTMSHWLEVLDLVFDFDELHIHIAKSLIDRRVMDNFIGDPDAIGGEVSPGFVGHSNRPFDAPAKPKGLR